MYWCFFSSQFFVFPGFWSTRSILFNKTVLEKAICEQAVPFETSPLDSSNFSKPCRASTSATTLSTMKLRCTFNENGEAWSLPGKSWKIQNTSGKIRKSMEHVLRKKAKCVKRMDFFLIHPRCELLFFVWPTHSCSYLSCESNQFIHPDISHCR